VTRRTALGFVLSSASFLGGCAGLGPSAVDTAAARTGSIGLLVPLSGPLAAVGLGMQRAAELARSAGRGAIRVETFDTTSGDAVQRAIGGGADLLLGPVTAAETQAVMAVAGTVPVVSFSNDAALAGRGAVVFGITPEQSVFAILRHARAEGLRRIAVVAAPGAFGTRAAEAAARLAPDLGLTLTATLLRDPAQPGLVAALRAGGPLPDAVLLPDGEGALERFAGDLSGTGVALLGTAQWALRPPNVVAALRGAAFAAPSPSRLAPFARAYEKAYGEAPGVLSALAFDAVRMAQVLVKDGPITRAGLSRPAGFPGVSGDFRVLASGLVTRELGILGVTSSGVDGDVG